MFESNAPGLKSWIDCPSDSDFPIQNIPFGIIRTKDNQTGVATIIGNTVIDLAALKSLGYFEKTEMKFLRNQYLNDFMALGKEHCREVRNTISRLFRSDNPEIRDHADLKRKILIPQKEVEMLMPVRVGNYTDFYSSKQHATNVGTMFRGEENALLPNWLHIPVGYHGRASSIVVSGTPIIRPKGQQIPAGQETPIFGPCKLLDFELEMAFVIGKENELGSAVNVDKAEDHIFGLCLFNDWSARDIQKWEYVPLGPFLGKNFASSVSPWIITLDALEPFRLAGPEQDPEVLPYLRYQGKRRFDIQLEVFLKPQEEEPTRISLSNFRNMYWNMSQQLAHHTVNGCNMEVGDMCASGTISGNTPDSYGSMLELSWKGTKPVKLNDGSERKFLQDGDTVIMKGYGIKDGVRIGFGEVKGKVLPAN